MSRIALVLAHRGRPADLTASLTSVFEQVRPADEVVVVDQVPGDTAAAVRPFAKRLAYIARPEGSLAAARNLGVRLSSAELVAFLDGGSRATPERLARQVAAMNADDSLVLCHGAVIATAAAGAPQSRALRLDSRQVGFDAQLGWLLERNRVATDTVCVRRQAFECVGGFTEEDGVSEDYDLWLRLAQAGPFRYIARPFAWQHRPDPIGDTGLAVGFAAEAAALARVPRDLVRPALERALPNECARDIVFAEVLLRCGRRADAGRRFRAAALRWPDSAAVWFHLANLAFDAGDLESAEHHCRVALDRRPVQPALLNNLGVVLAVRGNRAGAVDLFHRAASAKPLYADAAHNLEVVRRSSGGSGLRLTRRRLREPLTPFWRMTA
jgi:glycosyltransferase involved in cell wall biosynthesis